jgi:hypothetical protein
MRATATAKRILRAARGGSAPRAPSPARAPVDLLHHREWDSSRAMCVVCQQPYSDGDLLCTLPCEHDYHRECVVPWLLHHSTCPLCKANIVRPQDDQADASRETII